MLMYMFNPDHAGDAVHDALLAAARRGVEVKLLIDGFGSAAPPEFFADLAEAGGEHCVFNPSYGRRYLLRNHQKLVVADDRDRDHRRRQHRRHLSDRSRRRALARPVAAHRRARGRDRRAAISTRCSAGRQRKRPKLRSLRRMSRRIQRVARPAAVEVQRPVEHAQQLVAEHRPRHQARARGST